MQSLSQECEKKEPESKYSSDLTHLNSTIYGNVTEHAQQNISKWFHADITLRCVSC